MNFIQIYCKHLACTSTWITSSGSKKKKQKKNHFLIQVTLAVCSKSKKRNELQSNAYKHAQLSVTRVQEMCSFAQITDFAMYGARFNPLMFGFTNKDFSHSCCKVRSNLCFNINPWLTNWIQHFLAQNHIFSKFPQLILVRHRLKVASVKKERFMQMFEAA